MAATANKKMMTRGVQSDKYGLVMVMMMLITMLVTVRAMSMSMVIIQMKIIICILRATFRHIVEDEQVLDLQWHVGFC